MLGNTEKQVFSTTREERNNLNGHRSLVLWFTGLSGSGKSSIADEVEQRLSEKSMSTYVLDGDNIRNGINKDLSFSSEDRSENIRRVSEIAALFADAGVIAICSFISPFQKDRELARQIIGQDHFIEVFINTPLDVCETRDPKGLYKKVRKGLIPNFTGISSPYEAPDNAHIEIKTEELSIEESALRIIEYIHSNLKN